MISLTNHDFQWARSELVILIYPDRRPPSFKSHVVVIQVWREVRLQLSEPVLSALSLAHLNGAAGEPGERNDGEMMGKWWGNAETHGNSEDIVEHFFGCLENGLLIRSNISNLKNDDSACW